jgi:hypothetical protein
MELFMTHPSTDSQSKTADRDQRDRQSNNLPPGGLEKSDAIERQVPKPGKDVEKKMGENMTDRK